MSYYTRPHDPAEYGGGGPPGANYYDPTLDFSPAVSQARHQRRADKYSSSATSGARRRDDDNDDDNDSDPEDTSLFSKAISFLSEQKDKLGKEDIDEEKAVGAHQALYGGGHSAGGSGDGGSKHDADFLGRGAAMQALKMFLESDESKDKKDGGKHDQNKLIGIAMAQAGKLWEKDNKEGKAATDKQSAVNAAAKFALQMYLKSHGGGTSGTGGLGGLAGLAGKLISGGGGGSGNGGSSGGGPDLINIAKKFF
ncbi:hypothetical protein VTO42DRAFT_4880 [Malbranchea cinnamomea]